MSDSHASLHISRALVTRVLGAAVAAFVAINVVWEVLARRMGWVPNTKAFYLFDLDAEKNIATGFAALLLLIAGVLLAVIAIEKYARRDRFAFGWAFLSFGFHFMAVDELVSLHERLIYPMQSVLGGEDLGVLYFAWVVPGAALVLLLAAAYGRFFVSLPKPARRGFLIAAVVFLAGALGVELIGGRHVEAWGHTGLRYQLITTAEEGLEMGGMVIFIDALIGYLGSEFGEVRAAFGARTRADAGA